MGKYFFLYLSFSFIQYFYYSAIREEDVLGLSLKWNLNVLLTKKYRKFG